ncbi:hypothetical protein [Rugamonas sp. DEMB1]|uniref:hypothetical protein n=1 Tax=Rugamonas sp. DEMB1 TaxID=3039386 RepID=UPI00244C656E|nr:hypothetical protein [Rugamonas sp. DEMB1]WGG52238.1 hypothetical protein QC826_08725 [Rugamonas sp. DEMB1]
MSFLDNDPSGLQNLERIDEDEVDVVHVFHRPGQFVRLRRRDQWLQLRKLLQSGLRLLFVREHCGILHAAIRALLGRLRHRAALTEAAMPVPLAWQMSRRRGEKTINLRSNFWGFK